MTSKVAESGPGQFATAETYVEGTMNAADEVLGRALTGGLGDKPAIVEGDTVVTYAALNTRVNRYGHGLRALGVEPENRVMFLLDDSADLVAAYLAAIRIGAVAVAYNPRAAVRDLVFTINDTRCKVLFLEPDLVPVYEERVAPHIQHSLQIIVDSPTPSGDPRYPTFAEFGAEGVNELASVPMSPDDMAFWVYTSGTTGKPKAAVHLHHDVIILDLHLRENLGISPGERILCTSKLFFAYPLAHGFLGGLRCGATLILFRGWPEPKLIAELVQRYEPHAVFSIPTMYRKLLEEKHVVRVDAFRRVRCYVSAGEKLPLPIYEQWQRDATQPILEGIGATETLALFIANTPTAHHPAATGKPVPWAQVRLTDERDRPIEQPDTPGIAWLRMPSVCDRYWNRQDESRRSFRGSWFWTGDVFSFDRDGWWYHHGRGDHMIKISGQWVSPVEIEDCALTIDGVSEAAFVGIATAQGQTRSVLFVVASSDDLDQEALAETIQSTLHNHLAAYKRPRQIRFIEEIPRTATGKMQKFKLCELLEGEDA